MNSRRSEKGIYSTSRISTCSRPTISGIEACCSLVGAMRCLTLGLLLSFLLLGCGTVAPAAQPASSGGSQWDQVVAAAKKEGALVLTGQAGSAVAEALTSGFKRRYPEISVDFTGGNGNELITKMMTERRASRYTIDLMVQGPANLLDLVAAAP